MSKQVQIDQDFFLDLCDYLSQQDDPEANALFDRACEKLDKMIDREIFSLYKRAATAAERESYRQRYLDRRGISNGFRSEKETPYNKI